MPPTRRFEGVWHRRGLRPVAGVDEAGRGCLAGPVVAAAVILPRRPPVGIDDSKCLAPEKREEIFGGLCEAGAFIAWGLAAPAEIDRLNILRASFLAMTRAIERLPQVPRALLIDGFPIPGCAIPQRALVKGDRRSLSIAAASIVAKVIRDRMLVAAAQTFPGYGFARHKGYPTPEHRRALLRHGPCALHRQTFGPVREAATAGVAWWL